ncbi:MAG: dihydropteroate synthase [candidate division Zixibacteria bacterium]|nr:dihydropteroate synthase [candidate division Zixibacteria bacterium]
MLKESVHRTTKRPRFIELVGSRQLELSRPLVMGILNVTPDSFSDGRPEPISVEQWAEQVFRMEADGADIIDIGGESTRPGAEPVSPEEELRRVIPVIEQVRKHSQVPISIDTYRDQTALAALAAGADIVNDISALRFSAEMAGVVARKRAPVVLMHMLGTPPDMQKNPHYDDCVGEIAAFFEERLDFCGRSGIDESRIILDPGIGFGKRLVDNLDILAGLGELKRFECPLLLGASRKSFIQMLHPGERPPARRIGGSIAAAVAAVLNGADIVRVHDVHETVEALTVLQAIRETR